MIATVISKVNVNQFLFSELPFNACQSYPPYARFQGPFIPRCPFSPTAAATVLASGCYFCTPLISTQPLKVKICDRHVMASVQDIKIAEALFVLCFAYFVMKQARQC